MTVQWKYQFRRHSPHRRGDPASVHVVLRSDHKELIIAQTRQYLLHQLGQWLDGSTTQLRCSGEESLQPYNLTFLMELSAIIGVSCDLVDGYSNPVRLDDEGFYVPNSGKTWDQVPLF